MNPSDKVKGIFSEASWITASFGEAVPAMMRRMFSVKASISRAILRIASRGCFSCEIDGVKVSQDYFAPGWTDFRKRIPVVEYDVTSALVEPGRHVLGCVLWDGWCCGNLTIFRYRYFFHPRPELKALLILEYADGTLEEIGTDECWRASRGPVLSADLYDGEDYDARLELPGWSTAVFDDESWSPVTICHDEASDNLVYEYRASPPVRCIQELKPIAILHPAQYTWIWDFGQNFVGTYRVLLRGIAGRRYTFRTAEILEADGHLHTQNYRSARSSDSFICKGDLDVIEEFSPEYTFHGFRYLQIDGFQFDNISPEEVKVTGLVLSSEMPCTATFTTGNALLNRLWQNIQWSQKGNFLEIPTDCPQRDERLGWTGDAQIFAPTAMYNGDCRSFYRKYLQDIRDAVTEEGAAPSLAPAVIRLNDGASGWGDAIILLPYALWKHYGDCDVLRENYSAMRRHFAWQLAHSKDYLLAGKQFGDWLNKDERTPRPLITTAYFYRCARCLAEIASILGESKQAAEYAANANSIRNAFRNNYLGADGIVKPSTQSTLAIAIEFGLLDEAEMPANGQALKNAIDEAHGTLTTGFLTTPLILDALVKCGLAKTACDLLLQENCPGWLYPVKHGATTIWEHWDSYTEENGIKEPSMNSFNHYAFGAVGHFMMTRIGGIRYENGTVICDIIPDRRFAPVHAIYDSPKGRIESRWDLDDKGNLLWNITLPDGTVHELTEGTHTFNI